MQLGGDDTYKGITQFVSDIKLALMRAHNTIIDAQVNSICQANKKGKEISMEKGDKVYLSTTNLKMPKGYAKKLLPRYIRPFEIIHEVEQGLTFSLDLPHELQRRSISNTFHKSLLRPYEANDDLRFPGRRIYHIVGLGPEPVKWPINQTGVINYKAFDHLKDTAALDEYFEACGVEGIRSLARGRAPTPTPDDLKSEDEIETNRVKR